MKPNKRIQLTTIALAALVGVNGRAAEIGHYVPGLMNIRDFLVPEPGFYAAAYNYFYTTDRVNDGNGNEIDSITINPGPGPGVTLDLDVDVDLYALAVAMIYVTEIKPLGMKYGFLVTPNFANASLHGELSTVTGRGGSAEASNFDLGDIYVQPVWLGWTRQHCDFALAYGFYAPSGKYDTRSFTLPGGATVLAESADNIGFGFWTHQVQGAAAWYPWADKRMAISSVLTYETHQEKEDFDLTAGDNLTLNWGISQFLPLSKDHKLLLEVGPAGYSSWQISDDTGSDASNGNVHDEVHAVGGQLGLTSLPWSATLNVHYFYEFSADDRFQGQAFGINIAKKF